MRYPPYYSVTLCPVHLSQKRSTLKMVVGYKAALFPLAQGLTGQGKLI